MITRHYEKGDEVQITRLFESVFHQTMTVEQWRWKYTGQGLHDNKSAVAINEKGELAGHFGAIAVRAWCMNRSEMAYQAVDQMIDEKHRGGLQRKGLYYHLGSFYWESINSFKYGFVNLNHMRLGKVAGFFEDCISVKDHSLHVRKYLCPLFKLEHMDWDDKQIDVLWDKVYKGIGWSIIRDREFLKWRFKTNPFHTHKLYGLRRRCINGLLGWIVVNERDDALFLTDLLFIDEYLESLLKIVISMAYREDKKRIVLWLNNRYDERLSAMGSESVERGTYIPNIIRAKVCDNKEMNRNFYFTMGDTDFM
jgi:hypothetical protein